MDFQKEKKKSKLTVMEIEILDWNIDDFKNKFQDQHHRSTLVGLDLNNQCHSKIRTKLLDF